MANKYEVGSYEYKLSGDYVEFTGPSFMTWVQQANRLDIVECIAVILAATTNPVPMGEGRNVLDKCINDATFASDSAGGRQMSLLEFDTINRPLTRTQTAACEILLSAQRAAYKNKVSTLAILRMLLCIRSHDACNAPYDSYMRLATNKLEKY